MRIGVRALEDVMTDGWRALEEVWLGDWLLRASHGFTQRGNSALVIDDPGLPLAAAVSTVERWYAARDLPPRFCLVTDVAGSAADPSVSTRLAQSGYVSRSATYTMTALTADLPGPPRGARDVVVDDQVTPAWLAAFAAYRRLVPGVAEAILAGSHGQLFLSVPGEGSADAPPIAIARMSTYPQWAGIHAMWVAPEHRREGVATVVVAAVARLAAARDLSGVYLQVERSNSVATAAYDGWGFRAHHGHVYYAPADDGLGHS